MQFIVFVVCVYSFISSVEEKMLIKCKCSLKQKKNHFFLFETVFSLKNWIKVTFIYFQSMFHFFLLKTKKNWFDYFSFENKHKNRFENFLSFPDSNGHNITHVIN